MWQRHPASPPSNNPSKSPMWSLLTQPLPPILTPLPTHSAKQKMAKRCPKCGMATQKAEGCNKVRDREGG